MQLKQDKRSGRAWGYIRVSTLKQANSGLSLGEQRSAIENFCKQQHLELCGIFEDPAVSGKKSFSMRPGGSKLQTVLREGDTIVCKNFARAFRNTLDACHQAQRWYEIDKCYLVLLDMGGQIADYSSPMGKLIFTIMAATMQYEREARREHTIEVLAWRKEQGLHHRSLSPLGFKWMINSQGRARLERCEETWKTMELFHSLYYEKGMNIERILRYAVRLTRIVTRKRRNRILLDGKYSYVVTSTKATWGQKAIRDSIDMVQKEREAQCQTPAQAESSAS